MGKLVNDDELEGSKDNDGKISIPNPKEVIEKELTIEDIEQDLMNILSNIISHLEVNYYHDPLYTSKLLTYNSIKGLIYQKQGNEANVYRARQQEQDRQQKEEDDKPFNVPPDRVQ